MDNYKQKVNKNPSIYFKPGNNKDLGGSINSLFFYLLLTVIIKLGSKNPLSEPLVTILHISKNKHQFTLTITFVRLNLKKNKP